MNNHFFISYSGNKRKEVKLIYEQIKDNLENITTIIEPFCGSSALSYYLSTIHPGKFKYILNDNNKILIDIYKIFQEPLKLDEFVLRLNEMSIDINKEKYLTYVKKANECPYCWYYIHKICQIVPGLFPIKGKIKTDFEFIKKSPIINFIRTENIEFSHIDAISIFDTYKNDTNNLIFLDPPYMNTCNTLYKCPTINIYEYLLINKIDPLNSFVVLCLEDNWIIRFLFATNKTTTHDMRYEQSKRNTKHIIIVNK